MRNLIGIGIEQQWIKIAEKTGVFGSVRLISTLSDFMENEVSELDKQAFLLIGDVEHPRYPAWEWIHTLRNRYPQVLIALVLKNAMDPLSAILFKRLGEQYRILIISEENTPSDLEEYFYSLFSTNRGTNPRIPQQPVVVGWGTSPRVGVTSILAHSAIQTAKITNLKVGLIDLNFRAPDLKDYLGFTRSIKDFLLIQSDLSSRMLTPQTLIQSMVCKKDIPNLFYLLAPNRREYSSLITREEVDELIKIARTTFDITYIDVNSYPDNAATLRALKNATERWVITDLLPASFQLGWRDWYENVFQIYGLHLKDFKLIVNKTDKEIYNTASIAKAMGLNLVGDIHDLRQIMKENRYDPHLLSSFAADDAWNRSIYLLIKGLMERLGWADRIQTNQRMDWFEQMKTKIKTIRGA